MTGKFSLQKNSFHFKRKIHIENQYVMLWIRRKVFLCLAIIAFNVIHDLAQMYVYVGIFGTHA